MTETTPELRWAWAEAERWDDLVALFGPRGACGGCWCMEYRLPRREYDALKGEGAKEALRRRVTEGQRPGILAYEGARPVGWCGLGPRPEFRRLEHSRILAPIDDEAVVSIVCFYVDRLGRGTGVMRYLIRASIEAAREEGWSVLEAYPVVPKEVTRTPPVFAHAGVLPAFLAEGFERVSFRSDARAVVRYRVR